MSEAHRGLLADFRAGRRTALARVISVVENERPGFQAILDELHASLGRAHRIGITGPPGAGKSTLTSGLVSALRRQGETVAVIAVDPTSPFTGGALLGDRIRMGDIALDEGVFIRSMATRGSLGGLAVATREVADVLDAFGFDRVLIETVGVGQSELDIAAAADSTVVVLVPESGDAVQAMKAGLMEISDLFVVNKADRPGSERLAREIEMMLHLRTGQGSIRVPAHHGVDLRKLGARPDAPPTAEAETDSATPPGRAAWEIPVLRTVAERADGVPALKEMLDRHRSWLADSGELSGRRRDRLTQRVRDAVVRALLQLAWQDGDGARILEDSLPDLECGRQTPNQVAARIVRAARG